MQSLFIESVTVFINFVIIYSNKKQLQRKHEIVFFLICIVLIKGEIMLQKCLSKDDIMQQ